MKQISKMSIRKLVSTVCIILLCYAFLLFFVANMVKYFLIINTVKFCIRCNMIYIYIYTVYIYIYRQASRSENMLSPVLFEENCQSVVTYILYILNILKSNSGFISHTVTATVYYYALN